MLSKILIVRHEFYVNLGHDSCIILWSIHNLQHHSQKNPGQSIHIILRQDSNSILFNLLQVSRKILCSILKIPYRASRHRWGSDRILWGLLTEFWVDFYYKILNSILNAILLKTNLSLMLSWAQNPQWDVDMFTRKCLFPISTEEGFYWFTFVRFYGNGFVCRQKKFYTPPNSVAEICPAV